MYRHATDGELEHAGKQNRVRSKMTNKLVKGATLIVTFAAGFFASWYLFALMYSPTDHDFLVTTTSYYFKHMSDVEKLQYASYRD